MCEFVIGGEPHREMAVSIISRDKPVERHSHTQKYTRVHFFIKTQRRGGKDTKKVNGKLRTNGPSSRR